MNFLPAILPAILVATSQMSPAEEQNMSGPGTTATAVLGAGCFWCVEAVYQNLPGVLDVESGFAGGTGENPTYEQVCSGTTGHAEVVKITFNPALVRFEDLIDLFWQIHDPTDPRGVWPDFGPMYRSIILAVDDDQLAQAQRLKQAALARFPKPIVTEIAPLQAFYPAENYHQDFARKNPNHPYVRSVLLPKLEKAGMAPAAEEK